MLRVIFLDIDGVLNSKPFLALRPEAAGCPPEGGDWSLRFDPAAVARLQALLDRTAAKIVISSAWRNDLNIANAAMAAGAASVCDYIASLIHRKGAPRAEFISVCPDGNRGPSILAWVSAHAHEIRSWVALDDAAAIHMGGAEYRTVRTDENFGLRDADVERAVEMLSTDLY